MSTIDYNITQNTNKKNLKKQESTRTLKTAVSATDLRKLYSQGIGRQGRPLAKKSGHQPPLKVHLSKSPSAKDSDQRTKAINGNPEKDNRMLYTKTPQREDYIKIARQKDIIENAYFQLTQKYFGALSEIQEQKQKHQIQKGLLYQQIKQLRELVNRNSNKQIHHLFQIPVRGPLQSESKIIAEIDEAYETSNIHLIVPTDQSARRTSLTSDSNLSSLDIQSNQGSQIDKPQLSYIKKQKGK